MNIEQGMSNIEGGSTSTFCGSVFEIGAKRQDCGGAVCRMEIIKDKFTE